MSEWPDTGGAQADAAVAEAEAGAPTRAIQDEVAEQQASWRRHGPVYLVVALLLLVGWEATATVYQHYAVATEADWQAAAKALATRREAGEPLLFAPEWVAPLGREQLAAHVDLDLSTLSDVDRFPRVWQVSIRGARHRWLAGRQPKQTWPAGRVELALFDNPRPAKVLYDFYEQLPRASVDRVGSSPASCRKTMVRRAGRQPGPRFLCDARRRWNWVGWHLAEVGHRPYRCIYAHPVDDHRVRIAYVDVPLGDELVLYTGIDDFEQRKKAQTKVVLQVSFAGAPLGKVEHDNAWPWHRTVLDTSKLAGKRGKVTFEVSAPVAFARTFCFTADARRAR